MSGKFVIVLEDVGDDVVEVVAWDDWLHRPISERAWDAYVVEATDALAAWIRATTREGADDE